MGVSTLFSLLLFVICYKRGLLGADNGILSTQRLSET